MGNGKPSWARLTHTLLKNLAPKGVTFFGYEVTQ